MTDEKEKDPLREAIKGAEDHFLWDKSELMSASLPEGDYRKGQVHLLESLFTPIEGCDCPRCKRISKK